MPGADQPGWGLMPPPFLLHKMRSALLTTHHVRKKGAINLIRSRSSISLSRYRLPLIFESLLLISPLLHGCGSTLALLNFNLMLVL